MENASKALLIAGAILICIVLISVGMMIVSSATDVVDSSTDTTKSQAVQAFNSTFNNYQGNQKGSAIKTLLETISTSNSTNASGHEIGVTLKEKINGTATWPLGTQQSATGSTGSTGSSSQDSPLGEKSSSLISSAAADIVSSGKYKVKVTRKDAEGYILDIFIERQ